MIDYFTISKPLLAILDIGNFQRGHNALLVGGKAAFQLLFSVNNYYVYGWHENKCTNFPVVT